MAEAYIVGAVRTPVGKRNGGLSKLNPVDLAAHVLRELVARTGIDAAAVEDVIMGCVSQIGPQSLDIARQAWLSAGLPEQRARRHRGPAVRLVPAGAALRRAGRAVRHAGPGRRGRGGEHERGPDGVVHHAAAGEGDAAAVRRPGWKERYGDQEISQFRGAQLMCEKWGITRRQLEEFALASHQRAVRGDRRGPVRAGDHPGRRRRRGRGPAPGHLAGEDGRAGAAARGLGDHRGHRVPDLRRRGGAAGRLGGGGAAARADPARADRGPGRHRRRPGVHAHRARSPPPSRCWPRRA